MQTEIALVTGASRGIGKATAVALARVGFDVVVAARSLTGRERHDHSSTVHAVDTSPLPGSLEATAALVDALGRRAVPIVIDLLDPSSIERGFTEACRRLGPPTVLVNNGVYTGPGNMDRVQDLPIPMLQRALQANVLAPLRLSQLALPEMLRVGRGTIVNVTSIVAETPPVAPPERGGWGFAYGASKAAFHPQAASLHVELGHVGIRAFNVDPGVVLTERMAMRLAPGERVDAASPAVPAAVIAWLARSPDADRLAGQTIRARELCAERGWLSDWGTEPGATTAAQRTASPVD